MGAEPHHGPGHHAEVRPRQWPEHRLVSFAPYPPRSVHLLRPVAPCSQTLLRSGPTRRTWACVALFGSGKKGSPSFEPASTGSRPEDAQPRAPAPVCAPPSRRPLPSKLWDVLMPQKVKSQDFKGGAGPRQEKSQSKNGKRGSAHDPLMGPDRALCGRQRLGGRWPRAGRDLGSRQAPVVAGMGMRDTWSGNADPGMQSLHQSASWSHRQRFSHSRTPHTETNSPANHTDHSVSLCCSLLGTFAGARGWPLGPGCFTGLLHAGPGAQKLPVAPFKDTDPVWRALSPEGLQAQK